MSSLIGISTSSENINGLLHVQGARSYASSISMAGGTGVYLPVLPDVALAAEYLARLDGLLLTGGGEHVQPQNYGERAVKGLSCINPERDIWEFALFEAALEQGKPVLGICRGCHVINVAMGGSLHQDVRAQIATASEHQPSDTSRESLFHAVRIEEGTHLHSIFETSSLMVNSLHNQAVKDVASGLRVNARAEDGIVEGVESVMHSFVMGVQWHPEALAERYGHFVKLFRALVVAAQGSSKGDGRGAEATS